MSHDVVGVGEAMIRLSTPPGNRLEDTPRLDVHVGGAEANVAVAAARMGYRSAWLTRLPMNPLGRRAAADVGRHGVDVAHVAWAEDERMGLYFVDSGVAPRPTSVIYDRAGSAASHMTADHVAWDVVEAARIVHLSGITPALSEGCRDVVTQVIRRARRAGTRVSFDINYRAKLWSAADAATTLDELTRGVDLLISTAEDARDIFDIDGTALEKAAALAERCATERVVVTAGAAGAAWVDGTERGAADAFPAIDIDRVGSGDAFAAGAIMGLLAEDLELGVRQGLAMAALKRGIRGDHLVAGRDDVDAVMRGAARRVGR